MSRYRKIHVKMWSSASFQALSAPKPNAQTLFGYLLTGPHTTAIPGLFAIGQATLAEAIRWPLPSVKRCFAEIEAQEMAAADWKARLVYLPTALAHNMPINPNQIAGWRDDWALLPKCALLTKAEAEMSETISAMKDDFARAWAGVQAGVRFNTKLNVEAQRSGSTLRSTSESSLTRRVHEPGCGSDPDPVPDLRSGGSAEGGPPAGDHSAIRVAFGQGLQAAGVFVGVTDRAEEGMALDGEWILASRAGVSWPDFLRGLQREVGEWVRAVKAAGEERFQAGWRPSKFVAWGNDRDAALTTTTAHVWPELTPQELDS